jgi:signal transduction histidine kinase
VQVDTAPQPSGIALPGAIAAPDSFARRFGYPVAALLFAVVTIMRFEISSPSAGSLTLLYSLPIALCAITGGVRAGLLAAALSVALVAAWALTREEVTIAGIDYFTRAIAFGTTGGIVGWYADRSRSNMRRLREREEALESLSVELRERAHDLERSNGDLERFAYVASHDLAEPLRTISGFTTLLGRRYKGKLDRDADEFIGFIEDGTRRMQELINALLDLSRAGQGPKSRGEVDLAGTLGEVLNALHARIREQEAHVRGEGLPVVAGDPAQLRQLMQNLVANAVKFRAEAPPQVEITARELGRGRVEVSVADNGIGVPPEQAERIFEPFQRAAAGHEGAGIGLAVCSRIVSTHGGRIWVEPRPEGGSVFRFTLST